MCSSVHYLSARTYIQVDGQFGPRRRGGPVIRIAFMKNSETYLAVVRRGQGGAFTAQ